MDIKNSKILTKVKMSYAFILTEMLVLAGMCFGLTSGTLPFVRGSQYHTVGLIILFSLVFLIIIGSIYSVSTIIKCLKNPLSQLLS